VSISTIHKAERGTILLRRDRQQAIMVLAVGKESLAAPERVTTLGPLGRFRGPGQRVKKIQHCTKVSRQPLSRDLQSATLRWGFDET
jgi:hypothetical protein